MFRTTQDGIDILVNAAGAAALGDKREDALDAFNAWIGSSVRITLKQTLSTGVLTKFEATRATAATRTGETLSYPTTGWTIVSKAAINLDDGPLELRIEKSTDADRYIRIAVTDPGEYSLLSEFNGVDDPIIKISITANNIYDANQIPGAPTEYLYRIYDNPAAPVPVADSLVGSTLHRYPYSDTTESAEPTYGYGVAHIFDTDGAAWNATETSAGVYDWTALDEIIDYHYNAGRKVLYTFHGTPSFYAALPSHPSPYGINGFGSAPTDWSKPADFLAAFFTRYAGKIWGVQGPREPDLGFYDYYTGAGGTDRWIGSVEGNSAANKLQRATDYVRMQKVLFDAARAADPSIKVFFGGFVMFPSSGTEEVADQQVIDLGTTSYDGVEAKDMADVLGFHFYGDSTSSVDQYRSMRRLANTRAALRPELLLAIDEIGTDESYGSGFTTAQHIQVIEQALLIGAGFGLQTVGLYAHEQYDTLGAPEVNATVATAIDDMYTGMLGKSMVRAYVLTDSSVWVAFSDGSTLQSPGTTYTPPTDPDPDRDLSEHPFSINSVWNIDVGAGATFASAGDTQTDLVRYRVGLNQQNYSIPVFKASFSDSDLDVYVGPPGTPLAQRTKVTFKAPSNIQAFGPGWPEDSHVSCVNPEKTIIHEFWHWRNGSFPQEADSYTPAPIDGSGIEYMVGGDVPGGYRITGMAGWGSCRAYGGSSTAGLIRVSELNAGVIPHMIAFAQTIPEMSTPWVWPATRDDFNKTTGPNVKTGSIYAIPPSVDVDSFASSNGFNTAEKAILVALQDKGACCVDQSGVTCIYLEQTQLGSAPLVRNDKLQLAWNELRRITNHSQSTPKGNL